MFHQPVGGDPSHHLIGMGDAFAALIAEREGQRVGDILGCGGAEESGFGHIRTISGNAAQNKNKHILSRTTGALDRRNATM